MRLLITRPAGDAQALAAAELRARGHEVLACPLIVIEPTDEPKPNLTATQGFIVGDADGARALAEAVGVRTFPVFCDSAGTAAELARLGFTDARSADGDAAKLARFIERSLNPKLGGLVYVCSTSAPINLSAMLGNMGFAVRMAALYAVKRIDAMPDNVRSALESKALDGAVFFSADEARAFAHVVQRVNLDHTTSRLLAVVASPVVAAPLTVLKFARVVTAPKSDALTLIGFVDDSLLPQPEPEKPAPVEEPVAPPPPAPVVDVVAPEREPEPEPLPAPVEIPAPIVVDEPIVQVAESSPEPEAQIATEEISAARPSMFAALGALISRITAPKPAPKTESSPEPTPEIEAVSETQDVKTSSVSESIAKPQAAPESEPAVIVALEPQPEIVTPPEPVTQTDVDEVRTARPSLFAGLGALIGRLSAPKPAIQTVTPLEPESSAVPVAVAEPQVVVEAEPVASIAEEPPPTTIIEDQHPEEPVAASAEPSTTAPEPISLATKIAAFFRRKTKATDETLSDPAPEIQPSSGETPIENKSAPIEYAPIPEPEPVVEALPEPLPEPIVEEQITEAPKIEQEPELKPELEQPASTALERPSLLKKIAALFERSRPVKDEPQPEPAVEIETSTPETPAEPSPAPEVIVGVSPEPQPAPVSEESSHAELPLEVAGASQPALESPQPEPEPEEPAAPGQSLFAKIAGLFQRKHDQTAEPVPELEPESAPIPAQPEVITPAFESATPPEDKPTQQPEVPDVAAVVVPQPQPAPAREEPSPAELPLEVAGALEPAIESPQPEPALAESAPTRPGLLGKIAGLFQRPRDQRVELASEPDEAPPQIHAEAVTAEINTVVEPRQDKPTEQPAVPDVTTEVVPEPVAPAPVVLEPTVPEPPVPEPQPEPIAKPDLPLEPDVTLEPEIVPKPDVLLSEDSAEPLPEPAVSGKPSLWAKAKSLFGRDKQSAPDDRPVEIEQPASPPDTPPQADTPTPEPELEPAIAEPVSVTPPQPVPELIKTPEPQPEPPPPVPTPPPEPRVIDVPIEEKSPQKESPLATMPSAANPAAPAPNEDERTSLAQAATNQSDTLSKATAVDDPTTDKSDQPPRAATTRSSGRAARLLAEDAADARALNQRFRPSGGEGGPEVEPDTVDVQAAAMAAQAMAQPGISGFKKFVYFIVALLIIAVGTFAAAPWWAPQIRDAMQAVSSQPTTAPTLPATTDQLTAVQARADALAADVVTLNGRIAALEQRPASTSANDAAIKAIEQRLAVLESGLGTKTTAAPDGLGESVVNQARQLTNVSARIATLETAIGNVAKLEDLAKRLGALEGKSAEANSVLALGERVAGLEKRDSVAATALVLAAAQLRDAALAGRIYSVELETVNQLTARANVSFDAAPLSNDAAKGLMRTDALKNSFPAMAGITVRAGAIPDGSTTWLRRMFDQILSIINIRPFGVVEGTTPGAIVARAEQALRADNLPQAVSELDTLTGTAADAAKTWLAQAKARVTAEQALNDLSIRSVGAMGALSRTQPAAAP